MDHCMLKLENYYDLYLQDFIEEYKKHNYTNLSDSPLYKELRLLAKSINLFRDYLKLPRINLRAEIVQGLNKEENAK